MLLEMHAQFAVNKMTRSEEFTAASGSKLARETTTKLDFREARAQWGEDPVKAVSVTS